MSKSNEKEVKQNYENFIDEKLSNNNPLEKGRRKFPLRESEIQQQNIFYTPSDPL